MALEVFNSTLLNETDTNEELTILNNSFERELDGDLHFIGINLKKVKSTQKIALFCHNVFSTILVQRFQRYKEYGKDVNTSAGQKVIITKLPSDIFKNFQSHFLDMERLLKEKKINGVSMAFYDNNAKKIVESYKFMVFVDSGEIQTFTDYNGNQIAEVVSSESFENDKKLFLDIYEKVYNHCYELNPIEYDYVIPLLRFHFPKREDRKEYEKSLQEQPSSLRFSRRPTFGTANDASLIAARARKRLTYAIVSNHAR